MLSHFGNATVEFREEFVQSAQFIRISNHGNHNGKSAALELIKVNSLGFSTSHFDGDATKLQAQNRLLNARIFLCAAMASKLSTHAVAHGIGIGDEILSRVADSGRTSFMVPTDACACVR